MVVDLCEASQDDLPGGDFAAEVQTLSGARALAFVRRRRHLGALSSDLDRHVRQQVFMAGLIRSVLSSNVLLDPVRQQQVITQVGASVTVDQGVDLLELAGQMRGST